MLLVAFPAAATKSIPASEAAVIELRTAAEKPPPPHELFETVTWAQIGVHDKPVGLLNLRNYFAPLWQMVQHAHKEGFIYKEHTDMLYMANEPQVLLKLMAGHQPDPEAVRRWMRK